MKSEILDAIQAAPGYLVASIEAESPPESPPGDLVRRVVFYSGATVERVDFITGAVYDLAFDMDGADLSTLNAGAAPVLNGHEREDADDILGIVQLAERTARGYEAEIRLSNRDEVAGVRQDVVDGIIRNVSMGVSILELKKVSEPGDKRAKYLATKWKPFEVSIVPIGADPGARFLSMDPRLERLRAEAVSAPHGADDDGGQAAARLALEIKARRRRVLGH